MNGEPSGCGSAVVFFVFAAIVFSLGYAFGSYGMASHLHEKAIAAGVGRWVIDAKSGESEFVFGVTPTKR